MSMQGMLDGFDAPAARSAEIARVIVDVDLAHMDRPLDYVVPDTLVDQGSGGFTGARAILGQPCRRLGSSSALAARWMITWGVSSRLCLPRPC